jgi:hypothetical protein
MNHDTQLAQLADTMKLLISTDAIPVMHFNRL